MPLGHQLVLLWSWLGPLLFVGAVGACVGSLINVLVYRLPLGMSVVTPASRCPSCGTQLTWRENIPVLGWLLLRGRCRFCRAAISVRYPLVEAFTAAVFAGIWLLWYGGWRRSGWLGVDWLAMRPEWALNGIAETWPITAVALVAVSCLIAMTLIDAKTFTIPLALAWVPAVVAAVVLPLHSLMYELAHGGLALYIEGPPARWVFQDGESWRAASGWVWSLPTPWPTDWGLTLASIAGVAGVFVSAGLVKLGVIGRSFAGYEAWEAAFRSRREASGEPPLDEQELWLRYPHARGEMVKELAFCFAPIALLFAGALAAKPIAAGTVMPLWLTVLGGVALGYLVGGGVVWAFRIFGTLAFRKEAMGIGDVHLMAAAGACFGWIDAFIGFFAAGFFAAAHAAAGLLVGRLRRQMPFGPYLALGVVFVVLAKPLVERVLGSLMALGHPIDLP